MSNFERDDSEAGAAISEHELPTLRDVTAIEEEWQDFREGLPSGSMLRDVIEASWFRSREHGVDPIQAELHRVSDEDLARRQDKHRELIEIAKPHLDWLSVVLRDVDHGIYIADPDGVILCSAGNSPELRERYGLEPGYDWSEARMGTNGAGTALAAQKPVAVVGPEHFSQNLHRGICTAAPIRNTDAEVIGALDISVGMVEGTPARLAMAVRSAEMIESQLARQTAGRRLSAARRVLANVGHEVRTPMTVVQTYLDILRQTLDNPEQLHALDVIERNSDIMLDLLDDLLDLSRLEAGRAEVNKHPMALAGLLDDVEMMIGARAEEAGVAFAVETSSELPTHIATDEIRLRQILVNLVTNAVKFTPDGGEVTVRVQPRSDDPSRILFEVVDTGTGLSEDDIERIFEPFHTNEKHAAASCGGTGLGLTISRELVRALGGEIEVESLKGSGATFRFDLPIA